MNFDLARMKFDLARMNENRFPAAEIIFRQQISIFLPGNAFSGRFQDQSHRG